jgi:hypothetical protein
MKLPFNPFRKRRSSEPPPAARVELRRSHPRTPIQRRDAVYRVPDPPPVPPAPARPTPAPTPPSRPAAPVRDAPVRPPARPLPRARTRDANPRPIPGYGRRPSPPPEAPTERETKQRRLKSEAELRREIGPTMQYDDPT